MNDTTQNTRMETTLARLDQRLISLDERLDDITETLKTVQSEIVTHRELAVKVAVIEERLVPIQRFIYFLITTVIGQIITLAFLFIQR